MKVTAIPRAIWVLLVANLVIALGYGLVAPALPGFARSFDVTRAAATVVVSSFALMRLVSAPISGRLVTRLGERRVYLTGLAIVSVSTFACAFARTYWQLLVLRAAGGLGSAMFSVSALALLLRLAPPDLRGRTSGLFSAGFLVGSITGPLIGAALVGYGLRMPFVVYAVALVVASLVVATQLRGVGGRPGTTDTAGSTLAPALSFLATLRDPTYRAIITSSFTQGFASMGVRVALVPLFVTDATGLGKSAGWSGVVLAVYAGGNVVAIALAGRLSDQIGRRPLMLGGLALMAAGTLPLGYSNGLVAVCALSVVAGAGSGLFAPTHQAALGDLVAARAPGGTALAAFPMAGDIGGVCGPVIAGFIADRVGYGPAFALSGVVALVAIAFWVQARETAPQVTSV
ncbi:MFS transporter [Branchiibius cervicis]|uniref:MFS transporter n=1 Tax=Branchiibius cervicis TaxID=908252 RepID=A0ABW2AS19_9MICO